MTCSLLGYVRLEQRNSSSICQRHAVLLQHADCAESLLGATEARAKEGSNQAPHLALLTALCSFWVKG